MEVHRSGRVQAPGRRAEQHRGSESAMPLTPEDKGVAKAKTRCHNWRKGPDEGTAGESIRASFWAFAEEVTKVQSPGSPVWDRALPPDS